MAENGRSSGTKSSAFSQTPIMLSIILLSMTEALNLIVGSLLNLRRSGTDCGDEGIIIKTPFLMKIFSASSAMQKDVSPI